MHLKTDTESDVSFRRPQRRDGSTLWELIRTCKPLDENSPYAYLLLCEHFPETCVVAELDGRIVGFISGYRPPTRSDAVFVWQVAVHPGARGRKLGVRMLHELVNRPACADATRIETTVTPSNEASRRMFQSFARSINAELKSEDYFAANDLGDTGHEPERLITIGPLQ